jgi:long-chain acyl-CoA synthetase
MTVGAAAGVLLGLDGKGPHLVTGPLYHAAPLGFAAIDLANGAELVLMPRWDDSQCLRLIDERRVRNTHIVPTMCVRLLRLPEEERAAADLSSLSTVLHGAAPIAPQVKQRMIEWWGPVLTEYWGSTEGGVFTLVDSAAWLTKPGTVGKAIPTYEVFAVDPDGARLPPGEVGTLYTRNRVTDEVFEYHQAPEKTEAAHLAPGTFTMGDVGHVDEDGFVFLSDRAANMIISGGVNIYPAEIEQELMEHPAVADVAVFGIPDDEWGEQVKAAVELAAGYEPSAELEAELLLFARQRLAGFKVPRSVDFEAELPRHPTGKLYTRLLREKYWADRAGSV